MTDVLGVACNRADQLLAQYHPHGDLASYEDRSNSLRWVMDRLEGV